MTSFFYWTCNLSPEEIWVRVSCVFVCVCERERERQRQRETEIYVFMCLLWKAVLWRVGTHIFNPMIAYPW